MDDFDTYCREMTFGLLTLNKEDSKELFGLVIKHGLSKTEAIEGSYPTSDDHGTHTKYHGLQFTLKNGQKLKIITSSPGFLVGYHLERFPE